MNERKTISAIIPTYNSAEYLSEAIESVLRQTVPIKEIIVVDDGSTDHTKQVVQEFGSKIMYIFQENSGPAAARNRALKEASGEYISFLDADDYWHPEKLETQLKSFREKTNLGVSIGLTYKSEFSSYEDIDLDKALSESEFALLLGSGLMKRAVFEKIGNFDEDLIIGDDTDWFIRARENGIPISVNEKIVLYYRYHNKNLTKKNRIYYKSVFQILKKAKDRKASTNASMNPKKRKPENQDELKEMWHST